MNRFNPVNPKILYILLQTMASGRKELQNGCREVVWHVYPPRTTPSDFVCHPSNRGILCVVICNNAFIHCITHNLSQSPLLLKNLPQSTQSYTQSTQSVAASSLHSVRLAL
jgi:hypothetical protein